MVTRIAGGVAFVQLRPPLSLRASRPLWISQSRFTVTRSATSDATPMPGGDPIRSAERFARRRQVRPRSVDASSRKRLGPRQPRALDDREPRRAAARDRADAARDARPRPGAALVRREREAMGADHADAPVGRRDHEAGAARQPVTSAPLEVAGAVGRAREDARVGRRDVDRPGRRDQDARPRARPRRAPHPRGARVGAPDVAVLRQAEQRVALRRDGGHGGERRSARRGAMARRPRPTA